MTEVETQTQTRTRRDYVAIFIRPETRRLLALVKVMHGFKSYDDLIMRLLREAGYADQQD
jgi:hypothetical protein